MSVSTSVSVYPSITLGATPKPGSTSVLTLPQTIYEVSEFPAYSKSIGTGTTHFSLVVPNPPKEPSRLSMA
ncbi:hypothetical protein Syun_018850 [Stephania yunnanensis]|uniref:Uncharacterized protein n=1 Tax=Stephania yunnanensis TaxID=152371 RepID=A0AAP0IUL7_9MAGN